MKRILVICLTLIMLVSTSVVVFAAPNGFVSSPSGNPAPEIEAFEPKDEDCTASLHITPYADRNDLSEPLLELFENAYNDVVDADNLTELNDDFAALVASKNIDTENLAVSDLFDIHVSGCGVHEGHVDFDITLDADSLKSFVALLHMNHNGEWELVESARVTHNGEHLEFSVESFSPFAIVIDTTSDTQTGDNTMIYICLILMITSASVLVFVLIKSKRQKA